MKHFLGQRDVVIWRFVMFPVTLSCLLNADASHSHIICVCVFVCSFETLFILIGALTSYDVFS